MADNSTYTLLPEDEQQAEPAFSPRQMAELYNMIHDSDEPKRKKKKKKKKKEKGKGKGKKKGKIKKWDKAIVNLFGSDKKSRKKAKGKKSKSKKQSKRELKYRLIEMTTEKSLDTASYGAKRYFDHKWPV